MRIITGTARGCKLKTPKGQDTRPTADRIKESLFNILGNEVRERTVLDLFAGTGNLGLEALSRGARHAVFIDQSTDRLIHENAEHTHLSDKSEIFRGDVFLFMKRLQQLGRMFDLVFCDPPYNKMLWQRALALLDTINLLKPGAIVIVEHAKEDCGMPELGDLKIIRNQVYGSTTQISILKKSEVSEGELL